MPMDQQQHPPACDGGSFWRCGVNTRYTSTRRSASKTLCDDVEVALVGTTTSSYKGRNTADWVVKAVRALPYFSYRNRFEPLPNGSTHDTHWGCLVRTGQSMLAVGCMKISAAHAALEPTSSINHVADSQETHENNKSNNNTEKKTMSSSTTDAGRTSADVWRRWFMDIPTAPLGIHRIEVEAHKQGVSYASWLGPTQLGRALGAVSDALHASKNDDDGVLPPPILCFEGQIVVERLRQALREAGSCLVVLPVALGAKTIDGRYRVVMQRYLRMPTSCGMAGGHGAASVYIAGHQDELIIFTDPHYVQRAYAVPDRPGKLCATPRCLHITKMEPFVLLGFALANEADLTSFLDGIRSANKTLLLPLIMVDEADGAPPSSSS